MRPNHGACVYENRELPTGLKHVCQWTFPEALLLPWICACNCKLQSLLIFWILSKETSLHQKVILMMAPHHLSKWQDHSRHSVQAAVSWQDIYSIWHLQGASAAYGSLSDMWWGLTQLVSPTMSKQTSWCLWGKFSSAVGDLNQWGKMQNAHSGYWKD